MESRAKTFLVEILDETSTPGMNEYEDTYKDWTKHELDNPAEDEWKKANNIKENWGVIMEPPTTTKNTP